jgi:hypothetical protein
MQLRSSAPHRRSTKPMRRSAAGDRSAIQTPRRGINWHREPMRRGGLRVAVAGPPAPHYGRDSLGPSVLGPRCPVSDPLSNGVVEYCDEVVS